MQRRLTGLHTDRQTHTHTQIDRQTVINRHDDGYYPHIVSAARVKMHKVFTIPLIGIHMRCINEGHW